jgi:GNAT superfamily N-acetyltransferase
MSPEIVVTDSPDEAPREIILAGLRAYNAAQLGGDDHRPLAALVRDGKGGVLGGLWGSTAWHWLFVQFFWLPESLRGQGLGRELLRRAEAEARSRGCRAAWLDTLSSQARRFYEQQGYRVFGTLEDYPPGHRRFFLRKDLA